MPDDQHNTQEDIESVPPATDSSTEVIQTSPIPVIPQLFIALGILSMVFGIAFIGSTRMNASPHMSDVRVEQKIPPRAQKAETVASMFQDVDIIAKSAVVFDVQKQKFLFEKNANTPLPLASITKLMTAVVSYELLNPEEEIPITAQALKAEGNSGFTDGEKFRMQNLADLTLISSSNDGATALGLAAGNKIDTQAGEAGFVEAMNVKAEELGLTNTHFKNSTGLDVSTAEAGAYGSAEDVAKLMEYSITHMDTVVSQTKEDKTTIRDTSGVSHVAKNTNTFVNDIDGLIASKTGYTILAGGNLVVAFNVGLNRPIIIAVLGSTEEGRFTDTLALVKRVHAYIDEEIK